MHLVTPYLSRSYNQLKSLAQKLGINLFGMADIRRIKQGFYLPTSKTKGLNYGIVLGKPLSRYVLNTLKKGPNRIYLRHYLGVNRVLDKVAHQLARFIAQQGYRALVIPASRIINPVRKPVDNGETNNHSSHHDIREFSNGVNRQRLIGEVSHRQLGYLAGLGWIGRSSLLINPRYGAQVRYVKILTNLPLKTDRPIRNRGCRNCYACINICPAQAIKECADDFDRRMCYSKLKGFAKQTGSDLICGLCIKVCGDQLSTRIVSRSDNVSYVALPIEINQEMA